MGSQLPQCTMNALFFPRFCRAGCEPWSIWEGVDPKSEEYRKLKEERAKVLMDAVEVRGTNGCPQRLQYIVSALI